MPRSDGLKISWIFLVIDVGTRTRFREHPFHLQDVLPPFESQMKSVKVRRHRGFVAGNEGKKGP